MKSNNIPEQTETLQGLQSAIDKGIALLTAELQPPLRVERTVSLLLPSRTPCLTLLWLPGICQSYS